MRRIDVDVNVARHGLNYLWPFAERDLAFAVVEHGVDADRSMSAAGNHPFVAAELHPTE
ncbi:MAG: hypothetical protein QGG71_06885 [Pirellulaceae bacterium]|nr:hypothetical protein [Pirellulaceae bacterium]